MYIALTEARERIAALLHPMMLTHRPASLHPCSDLVNRCDDNGRAAEAQQYQLLLVYGIQHKRFDDA